jgi:hypothetical protein
MALLQDRTASFIVRIWHEPNDLDGGSREWRGSIEHVGSGQKAFFRDLNAIAVFMNPVLESIGVDLGDTFWERMSSSVAAPDPEPSRAPDGASRKLPHPRKKPWQR